MAKKNDDHLIMYVRKGATLKEIYAQARREFTAADLQRFTEIDEEIPMERVLAELEEIHRKEAEKLKKTSPKKKKPSKKKK